jgi:hypothetical protein
LPTDQNELEYALTDAANAFMDSETLTLEVESVAGGAVGSDASCQPEGPGGNGPEPSRLEIARDACQLAQTDVSSIIASALSTAQQQIEAASTRAFHALDETTLELQHESEAKLRSTELAHQQERTELQSSIESLEERVARQDQELERAHRLLERASFLLGARSRHHVSFRSIGDTITKASTL